jgi:hypothetical protein
MSGIFSAYSRAEPCSLGVNAKSGFGIDGASPLQTSPQGLAQPFEPAKRPAGELSRVESAEIYFKIYPTASNCMG